MLNAQETVLNVSTSLVFKDYWKHFKLRWGFGRAKSRVKPGIYATGNPDSGSHVFVSSNYQMSFNKLRAALDGINAWILVIDTKGVNVWCAAGKGTFGTEEIVKKIRDFKLENLVEHKKLIVPQLGAPGTSAQKVKQETGFNVVWGPVRAVDIMEFLKNDLKASGEMRKVNFTFLDRLVLIPLEFVRAMKYFVMGSMFLYLVASIGPAGLVFSQTHEKGAPLVISLFVAFITGLVFTPLLLQFIAFRSFTLKGLSIGFIMQLFYIVPSGLTFSSFQKLGILMVMPAVSAFLALNFTGCSTYTSQSGVNKEIKLFLKPLAASIVIGTVLIVLSTLGVI